MLSNSVAFHDTRSSNNRQTWTLRAHKRRHPYSSSLDLETIFFCETRCKILLLVATRPVRCLVHSLKNSLIVLQQSLEQQFLRIILETRPGCDQAVSLRLTTDEEAACRHAVRLSVLFESLSARSVSTFCMPCNFPVFVLFKLFDSARSRFLHEATGKWVRWAHCISSD